MHEIGLVDAKNQQVIAHSTNSCIEYDAACLWMHMKQTGHWSRRFPFDGKVFTAKIMDF